MDTLKRIILNDRDEEGRYGIWNYEQILRAVLAWLELKRDSHKKEGCSDCSVIDEYQMLLEELING